MTNFPDKIEIDYFTLHKSPLSKNLATYTSHKDIQIPYVQLTYNPTQKHLTIENIQKSPLCPKGLTNKTLETLLKTFEINTIKFKFVHERETKKNIRSLNPQGPFSLITTNQINSPFLKSLHKLGYKQIKIENKCRISFNLTGKKPSQ